MKRYLVGILLSLLVAPSFAAISPAAASAARTLLPAVSPANVGQAQKNLQQQTQPQQATPLGGSNIREMTPEAQAAEAAAAKITFVLTKVTFKGNTVYSQEELEKIFSPFYNKKISLADLQNLVQEVTKKYRIAGYVLSRAILPPQTIKKGALEVQVIEGFISDVIIEGNPGKNKTTLNKVSEELKASRPLNIHVMERKMLIVNDIPGVVVQAVLTPSKTIPGSADLTLAVNQTWLGGSFSYDNYGTYYLGPQQLTVSANANSLFGGDMVSLRYVTTPRPEQLKFSGLDYSKFVGTNGLRWGLGGNYTETLPGFVLEPFLIHGRTALVYGNISYPMIRTRAENFAIRATANYQNVSSNILGTPLYYDRIRSLVIGGSYDVVDRWQGSDSVLLNLSHGFDIMGAQQHVNQSRIGGLPNFTKIEMYASRLKYYSPRVSLLLGFHGQYAMNPLLASEQYGYGGPDYGRGYDPSEIVGDDGAAGKFEVRLDTPTDFKLLRGVQFYTFYDAGIVWNRDPIGLPARKAAMSTGVGARFTLVPHLTGNFMIAKPLTLPVATLQLKGVDAKRERFFFQVVLSS